MSSKTPWGFKSDICMVKYHDKPWPRPDLSWPWWEVGWLKTCILKLKLKWLYMYRAKNWKSPNFGAIWAKRGVRGWILPNNFVAKRCAWTWSIISGKNKCLPWKRYHVPDQNQYFWPFLSKTGSGDRFDWNFLSKDVPGPKLSFYI